VPSLAPLSVAA